MPLTPVCEAVDMRQILPTVQQPVDLLEVYGAPLPGRGRPGVRLNMISSADGATAVAGRSGGLGGPGDQEVFSAIRAAADVVLVAAGTVRAEGYGAIGIPVAVVTRSCHLDWESPLFSEPGPRPLVVTTEEAPAAALERASEVAELVLTGSGRGGPGTVDLVQAVAELGRRGHERVLAEGGPSLNGQLAVEGLIDELCLTLAPALVAGPATRVAVAATETGPSRLGLLSMCEQDGYLFLRYAVQHDR
jgi:riboflavin biosynthesis pyrimidine reductase